MQHVVAAELAWAATQAGHATLRFNHRGVGASQGRRGDLSARVEDARAALTLLLENSGAPCAVVAALHGAANVALGLAASTPAVRALAFISPLSLEPASLATCGLPIRIILGSLEAWRPPEAVVFALTRNGGGVEVVAHADQRFLRNLPQVGRAVTALLADVHA
jgi:alpha/beta superfamily hydrolase